MPTVYPRLNLGAIRAKVRTLTAIESTNLVTNAHLNNLINEELHKVILIADEIEQAWTTSIAPGATPVTVVESGVTYRVPGWRFDNTTQFPTGMPGNIILSIDADLPPWNTTGNGQYKAGYYDNYLVYKVSARLLLEQDDDSKRHEEFQKRADEIFSTLIEQEYISHNADLLSTIANNTANYQLFLLFKTLFLLQIPTSFDSKYSVPVLEINEAINASKNELMGKYTWPFAGTVYSDFAPYSDIFAYAAAGRLASRFGLSDNVKAELTADYASREEALVREKLTNSSGLTNPSTLGNMILQVRALLRDFSTEIPSNLITNWINTEYQLLLREHDWPFLIQNTTVTLNAGSNTINLASSGLAWEVLNVYTSKMDGNNVTDSQIVSPVPHVLDVEVNESRYRYDVNSGIITIAPTPTEPTIFRVRWKGNPNALLNSNDQPIFESYFSAYLVYRAAYLGSAWSDNAKKLAEMFIGEAERIKTLMYKHYITDHSTEPFSIGENALETRKYLPFFKAV